MALPDEGRQTVELVGLAPETLSADAEKWIDRAASLGSLIERHRDESERGRCLARPVADALRDGGFFRLWVPRAFGGEQLGADVACRALEELARWDGSTAWNATLTSGLGPLAEYLPREAAEQVWGTRQTGANVLAGSIFPAGRAVAVGGGYRVSGRFPFCSNGQHSDWLITACVVLADGEMVIQQDGTPEARMLFMPTGEVEFLDTWHTLGLRGTGSHHFTVDDVFVPTERSFPMDRLAVGPSRTEAEPVYPYPYYVFAGVGAPAVSLGIARAAIDTFRTLAATKTPTAGATALAEQHTVQERVGRAEAMVAAARSFLFEAMHRVTEAGPGARPDVGATVRLACAYATEQCAEVVKMMYTAGGGTSLYEASPLERQFRDVHMITQHVAVAPFHIEMVGRYLLGGGLEMRR